MVEEDGYNVTVELTESVRVAAMYLSSTDAGDGVDPCILDIGRNSVLDIAQNFNGQKFSLVMTEFPDEDSPRFLSASLNYSTGILIIHCQETLRLSDGTRNKISKYFISNNTPRTSEISLDGAQFLPEIQQNALTITIRLLEKQRAQSIAISGTPGGDGGG